MKQDPRIQDFINELTQFAGVAEDTLSKIEQDKEANKNLFGVFSEKMFAIRGTAQQLELPHIAKIAGLAEEIAIKGQSSDSRSQIRKCIGSLWDALTTVKYMLEHYLDGESEEQQILMRRLESTLKAFGGARPSVDADEIERMLKSRS